MSDHKCCKRIFGGALPFRGKPCSRKGVIERDGLFYCRQHDPISAAKAQEKRATEYELRFSESLKIRRLQAAAPDLLEALEDALEHIPKTLQKRALEAINNAKGLKP